MNSKGNNGSESEAGHHRHYREEKTTMVWPRQKDARRENTKTNYGMDTTGENEKRTPKEDVDGRSTSSHDYKKIKIRAMEKQRGMTCGFWKTATAVKNTG